MCKNNPFICFCQVLTPVLLFCLQGFTQVTGSNFFVGESGRFAVKPVQGVSYCWKVRECLDQSKKAETDKATYLSSPCDSMVTIRWERSGIFYLTVTGYNQNGCSNSKVFAVVVLGEHLPMARNDYATADWLKNIRLNLLDNDFDAKNDLDPASLTLITQPEFGVVRLGRTGNMDYSPTANHAAIDKFYYRICDACNQCDTARVTITLTDPPLFLPEGFSPNGDGINDKFVIGGLDAYPKSSLTVFSRDGIVVFESSCYQNDWNGVPNHPGYSQRPVAAGTYYYVLHLGGTNRVIKGFLYLAE